ncbi:MAG TPA: hypothetical protein VHA53_12535 [Nitrolancea sp.]|nr:hypothetical protein [Nitrolancea sp.]
MTFEERRGVPTTYVPPEPRPALNRRAKTTKPTEGVERTYATLLSLVRDFVFVALGLKPRLTEFERTDIGTHALI